MKLPNANKDFNADKENAAITFASKSDEKLDQAVVFNSKRSKLRIVLEKQNRKSLLHNSSTESVQRDVLNVNYGSPNIIAGSTIHKHEKSSFSGSRPKRKTKTDRNDTSATTSVHKVVIKQKKKTMNDNSGNVSKTQAFHKNIICQAAILGRDVNAKRTTVFGESRNTLMTGIGLGKQQNSGATLPEQRRGVYKDNTYNKSKIQAVSYNKKHKTKEYESDQDSLSKKQTLSPNKKGSRKKPADNDKDNISMTQALSSNVLDEKVNKRITIVSDDEAVTASIMLSDKQTKEKCRTIHKNEGRKITVTKAVHLNIILLNNETNKGKKTVVHEANKRNLPTIRKTTQQLKVTPEYRDEKPIAVFETSLKVRTKKNTTIAYDNDVGNALIFGNKKEEPRNKRKTYDDDEANICPSIANNNEIYLTAENKPEEIKDVKPEVIDSDIMKEANDKMKLIDYDEFETDKGDVSGTEAIAAETESLAYDDDINLTIPTNTYLLNNLESETDISTHKDLLELKQALIEIDLHLEDILKQTEDTLQSKSKFTVFNGNHLTPQTSIPTIEVFSETDKNRTVMCDNDKCRYCNISVAQPIPAELITAETEFNAEKNKPASCEPNITVLQASTINSRQATANTNENINSKESFYRYPPIVSVKNTNEPKVPVVSSPIPPISDIPRFVHPKDIEKLQVKRISSTTDSNIDKVFDGDDDITIQIDDEEKTSQSNILDRAIDTGDKTSYPPSVAIRQDTAAECMFYVMKNSEVASRTDRRLNSAKLKDKDNTELKKFMAQNIDIPSRSVKEDKIDEQVDIEQQNYNQSIADITRELLSLISNITRNVTYEDDCKPAVMKVENQYGQATKHKRLNPGSNRESIAFSNISMAQPVLQKSRDSNYADEDTRDTSGDVSEKSDRASHKVDKTTFSIECINKTTLKYEEKCAPLKKTTFDESSHIIDETKKKVIPTYPCEVSEGIKELMLDLVKPVSDNNMVENKLICSENTPMHSAEIQADLYTSRFIDKTTMHKDLPVLVFDYHNPLHNILLAPPDLLDVHKYNPIKCNEVESLTSRKQEKICVCQKDNHLSTYSSSSKKSRVERVEKSVDAVSTHVMHDEANTLIAMRRNEELLQASSSLTIVEDITKSINRSLTSDNSTFANHWRFSSQIDTEDKHRGVDSSHSRVSATFSNKHICNHATDKNKQNSASMEMIPMIQKGPYISPHKPCTELSSNDSTHKMGPIKQQYNKNASQVAEMKSPRNNLTYIYFVEQSIQPAALIFDHQIPVNDIQLTPNNFSDGHKYSPRKTEETLCSSASSYKMSEGEGVEKDLSSMQHTIEPGVDAVQQDSVSNGPNTVHKLVDTDDEVNPGGMEGNKELLGASFSLTVGDESKAENISKIRKRSDLKIDSLRPPLVNIEDETAKIDTIAKIIRNSSGDQFSYLNSREMLNDSDLMENYKQYSSMEMTPKPVMKIQNATMPHKVNTEFISMDDFTHNHIPEKDATETNKEFAQLSTNCEKKLPRSKETPLSVEEPNPVVLVFDLKNPLNNIRFVPTNMTDANKYQPRQTEESPYDYRSQLMNEGHILMTTLYVRKPEPSTKQDDMFNYKKDDKFNFQSANRRSISTEQSLDDDLTQESEGNITITFRGNQKLHESISSMTLVVDELESKNRVSTSKENLKRGKKITRSLPGHKKKQATKTANQSNAKLQGNSSGDPFHSSSSPKKDKKRILLPNKAKQRSLSVKMTKHKMVADKKMLKYSPCKDKQHPPPITVKPVTKIQNVTKLNKVTEGLLSTKNYTPTTKDLTEHINQIATKISSKNKITKPEKMNTVQPFLSDYHNIEIDHKDNDDLKNKLEDFKNKKYESLTATEASFTSSNNLRDDNSHRQISKQDLALLDQYFNYEKLHRLKVRTVQ